jgi:hypothetical protein
VFRASRRAHLFDGPRARVSPRDSRASGDVCGAARRRASPNSPK